MKKITDRNSLKHKQNNFDMKWNDKKSQQKKDAQKKEDSVFETLGKASLYFGDIT
jgi:hypothetical protein